MVLPNPQEGLPPVLALAFDPQAAMADDPDQSAIRDLRITLDVPHIESGLQPFERMVRIATSLAQEMDGAMVDDSGQPLNPKAMESIARDLVELYRVLDARDLAAGSPLARRLFA
jgi:FtsZ-interacting cell division protein ZipA